MDAVSLTGCMLRRVIEERSMDLYAQHRAETDQAFERM